MNFPPHKPHPQVVPRATRAPEEREDPPNARPKKRARLPGKHRREHLFTLARMSRGPACQGSMAAPEAPDK